LQFSTDAANWSTWDGTTTLQSVNNVLYLRGSGNTKITGGTSEKWVITSAGEVSCDGDIRTLLDYEHPDSTIMGSDCFKDMFYGCTSLETAPELPATTLEDNCYESMFHGCESLVEAPELPAKTLKRECY
ncbi:MAG: hypothetical protein IJS80_05925, partial [Lachnospiraceae bacterium]|nr:hypothetical protein [Lachnospiraceae bacterium]